MDDKLLPATPTWPARWPATACGSTSRCGLLCVFAPAGFERRFERLLAEQAGQPPPERSAAERETRILEPPP
jgi:hypothetical protein